MRRADEIAHLQAEMRVCRRCLDDGYDIVPGAVFSGDETAEVLLIGQAPGVTEVEAKRPFNAGSGRRLFEWLGAAGWDEDDFRGRHYMTAVTKCYPGKANNGKGDRVPTRAEQKLCRPFLERELELVRPRLILLVGKLAMSLLYPRRRRLDETIGTGLYFDADTVAAHPLTLKRKPGTEISAYAGQTDGRFVVPLPHPSGASLWPNRPQNKALIARAVDLLADIRTAWGL